MSTLSRLLAEKKAVELPRCVEDSFSPVAMITFCPMQAKEWSLPWARLDAVSFSDEEESERIELFFAHHHVIVVGEHLRAIMDDILHFTIRCLRNLPEAHRATLKAGDTFIARLEIKLLSEEKSRPLPGAPR